MKKIYIVGLSGSGKSTLARKLAEISGNRVVHVDLITPRGSMKVSPEKRDEFETILKSEGWILDGCPLEYRDEAIQRSDVYVYLQIEDRQRKKNLLKRVWSQVFNPNSATNRQESPFRLRTYRRIMASRGAMIEAEIEQRIARFSTDTEVIRIRSHLENAAFIDRYRTYYAT